MGFDPALLKQLVETFKFELEERLQVMTEGLLELEKKPLDETKQIHFIANVFRAAHNIKGTSRSLSINNVADIAHHIESIFSSLQNKEQQITPRIVSLCFEAVDKMRSAMQCYLENQPLSFNLVDLLMRLEKKQLAEADLLPSQREQTPIQEKKEKKEKKKKVAQQPQNKTLPKSHDPQPTATKNMHLHDAKGKKIKKETTIKAKPPALTTKHSTPVMEKPNVTTENQPSFNTPTTSTTHETIRVSIENLDRIAALIEEMQLNKITINEHNEELSKLAIAMKQLMQLWQQTHGAQKDNFSTLSKEALQKIYNSSNDSLIEINLSMHLLEKNIRLSINELNTLSHTLQEEIQMLRLIPAANLLQTLPRAVRDLAIEMDKKVELSISGDDIKMDKMILEGLKDPIIHLLRNAIDHGIETPSVRKAKGKADVGHIWLDVIEAGNKILIRIKDDGSGIDVNNIADLYEKKKLLSPAELKSMGPADILELIFRPGFSTREIITNVSGRGIGLNVVKENIINLKGEVNLTTELGKSTTFDLHVPLTLASERGLIVSCGGQLFVIPTVAVQKVLSIKANEIVEAGASQVLLVDNHPIPLRSLANILNVVHREPLLTDELSLVVITHGWHAVALLVERIVGEREIVVKPLHAPVNNIPGIAGGTLSGSGQVMIVLNPSVIINMALQLAQTTLINIQEEKTAAVQTHILVVDDSITTRTLEKSILENKGYHVTTAVDGKEAWDILQKQAFSLLITDVMMPNVDGFTLTDRVKKTEKLQGLPVIIVTSLGNDAEKKRGIEVGADAYIVKSEFESGILLEIVEQLV